MFSKLFNVFTNRKEPHKRSIDSLFEAAKKGDPESQYLLSLKYLYGDEIEKDEGAFERWALSAYEQGCADALYKLAHYHRNSEGSMRADLKGEKTIPHIELAYKEFEILAKSGLLEAQEILGDMYRVGEGFGIEEDKEKSLKWYEVAVSNGSERAREIVKYMKENEL